MAKTQPVRPRLDSNSLIELLKVRYPANRYALLEEVHNAAGFNMKRRADAIAVALWPSDGLRVTGFEVKVSRSDLLNELAKPEKAEEFRKYCDYWYLVTDDGVIPDMSIIPETWGVMIASANAKILKTVRAAKLNESPVPLDRSFIAAMLKRAQSIGATAAQIADAKKAGASDAQWQVKHSREELAELTRKVQEFEKASGLSIMHGWHDASKIGDAVRLIIEARSGYDYGFSRLEKIAQQAVAGLAEIRAALAKTSSADKEQEEAA